MNFSTHASPQIIDIGAPSWCWSQLGIGGEGILSFEGPRGRLSRAVPYAVTDGQISISLAGIDETGWRAAGSDATASSDQLFLNTPRVRGYYETSLPD